MSEPFHPPMPVRFGAFEVNLPTRELRKRGVKIRLQEKPLELLIALLERPGEVITREILREKLWPGNTFVDFDHGLNNAVNRLREALCDSADKPLFIETVPRLGYRFIGQIKADPPSETALPAPEPVMAPLSEKRRLPTLWIAAVGVAAVCVGWLSVRHSLKAAPIESIAVLPLANLAPNGSEDYFADGMTEELITQLAKTGSLRVISRTSVMRYRNTSQPLAEIGAALNVDALVEGTVRRSGERVRITVQLVRTSPERHLWAEAYDGDIRDILSLQREAATDIVSRIQTKLVASKAVSLGTTRRLDPGTYENYLRGRYFLARRNVDAMNKAVAYFRQALQQDPQYARAYASLAVAYDLLGMYEVLAPEQSFPLAKAFASEGLQLDPTLAEAYTARAAAASSWEFDWAAAERDFEHAIALDPSSAFAHHWYGEHLINVGKAERAVSELERARELDPLSLPINSTLGRVYRDARRFDKALDQCKKTIELDPNLAMAHWCLGQAYLGKRDFSKAIPELERANALGTTPLLTCDLAYAYAGIGRFAEARNLLQNLQKSPGAAYPSPYLRAVIYGELGEKDRAFQNLDRAYREHDSHITYLALDPELDSLRSDPRFPTLLRRLRIPE